MSLLSKLASVAARSAFRSRLLAGILDRLIGGRLAPNSFAQFYTERYFWRYSGIRPSDVRLIVDVGANEGWEAERFLVQYPNVTCIMFEADPEQYERLVKRFERRKDRVKCFCYAVSDKPGIAEFFATTNPTAGSLLPLSDGAGKGDLARKSSFRVECVTLDGFFDSHPELLGEGVDLLWADVQGTELAVLKGAEHTLLRCRSVFLEVWTKLGLYEGASEYPEIAAFLNRRGFTPAILGIAPLEGSGDALWTRENLGDTASG